MENLKNKIKISEEFYKTLSKQEQKAVEDYGNQLMKDNLKYKAQVQSDIQKSFGEFIKSKK